MGSSLLFLCSTKIKKTGYPFYTYQTLLCLDEWCLLWKQKQYDKLIELSREEYNNGNKLINNVMLTYYWYHIAGQAERTEEAETYRQYVLDYQRKDVFIEFLSTINFF